MGSPPKASRSLSPSLLLFSIQIDDEMLYRKYKISITNQNFIRDVQCDVIYSFIISKHDLTYTLLAYLNGFKNTVERLFNAEDFRLLQALLKTISIKISIRNTEKEKKVWAYLRSSRWMLLLWQKFFEIIFC